MNLKPCPFCGGEPYEEQFPTLHTIGCPSCHFHIYGDGIHADSKLIHVEGSKYKYSEGDLKHETVMRERWNKRYDY